MVCLWWLIRGIIWFKIFWDYRTSDKTYEKLQDEYAVDDSKKSDDNGSEAADTPWYDDIDIDFAGLRSENPDVVGWDLL